MDALEDSDKTFFTDGQTEKKLSGTSHDKSTMLIVIREV